MPLIRCIDKRKRRNIRQTQRCHLQDYRSQICPQNFRIGKLRAGVKVLFRIQADTYPFRNTSTTSFTLVGGRLRNRLNRQTLNFGAIAITGNTCRSCIYHILDIRDSQRGFRHVSSKNNAVQVAWIKNALLFCGR